MVSQNMTPQQAELAKRLDDYRIDAIDAKNTPLSAKVGQGEWLDRGLHHQGH